MLIKKLELENFRQYIGNQTIEFSTEREKNVTVLIGVNTSGKTTLVRAFEWVLYGTNEFDDKNLLNKKEANAKIPPHNKALISARNNMTPNWIPPTSPKKIDIINPNKAPYIDNFRLNIKSPYK